MKLLYSILALILTINVYSQTFRDSVNVLHYDIHLNIPNLSQKTFDGTTTITFVPNYYNYQKVEFDLIAIKIESITFNNQRIKHWTEDSSTFYFYLKNPINKQDTCKLTVVYTVQQVEDSYWGGLYFKPNNIFNMGVGMLSTPPSFGRVWFPCNDIFTDKATFDYYITTDKKLKAACGGILQSTDNNGDLVTVHWHQSQSIPTYLAAFSVANYDTINEVYHGIQRDIPIEIFTFKGKKRITTASLNNLPKALNAFETMFGAYQFDRVGYCEVNFDAGAMEHAENISMTSSAFTGNLDNESILYHELSHSWFGDLVTCATPKDMWLNEGWASYCEALFFEKVYGVDEYKYENRQRHFYAVNFAHQDDYGYKVIADIDQANTYGTTIYKKGADVVQSLRHYMGDSLFFNTTRAYLKAFAFKNASIADFEKFFIDYSKLNLNDFFVFWLHSSGYPFFEIKNYNVEKTGNAYKVNVTIGQRIIGGKNLENSNKLEIFFVDSNLLMTKRIFEFSGAMGNQTFDVPFYPALVSLDLDEHVTDATVDKYVIAKDTGNYQFDESLCDVQVTNITDSSLIRIVCNYISPDSSNIKGYLIQQNYYWTVEGIWNKDFKAIGKFYLTTLMDLNFTKLHKPSDIILMYRQNSFSAWKPIYYQYEYDFLQAELRQGQYALAVKR